MTAQPLDPIYFDHNATTPLDPRVRDAMLPWFDELHGNPSSVHSFGRRAHEAVEQAREQVALACGASHCDVIFTGSGSEANNTVIFGIAEACGFRGHVISTSLEHPSVRKALARVASAGLRVTELRPGASGCVDVDDFERALGVDTQLVILMLANNELGTLQPVAEVAGRCQERGIPLLTDAVQAVGKIDVDMQQLGASYLTLGGHKFHGPSGVAALVVAAEAPLRPLIVGGSQEHGVRASTENVPGIVGLGAACELARLELAERAAHLTQLRDHFEQGLHQLPNAIIHCPKSPRLPHTSHVAFAGVSGAALMMWLDAQGIAVSTGSACFASAPDGDAATEHVASSAEPSRVLLHMGIEPQEALASIRVSFGLTNQLWEIDRFLKVLHQGLGHLRTRRL